MMNLNLYGPNNVASNYTKAKINRLGEIYKSTIKMGFLDMLFQ